MTFQNLISSDDLNSRAGRRLTIAEVRDRLDQLLVDGASPDAQLCQRYNPNRLVDEIGFETPEDVTGLSADELIGRLRDAALLPEGREQIQEEIVRRLRAYEQA